MCVVFRAEQDVQTIRHLNAFLKKPFERATKRDMIRFLNHLQDRMKASTVHNHKMRVKKLYQWLFQCEYRTYPEAARWIRTNNQRSTKAKGLEIAVKPEDSLTNDDIHKMIKAVDHPRDQALLAFTYVLKYSSLRLFTAKETYSEEISSNGRHSSHNSASTFVYKTGKREDPSFVHQKKAIFPFFFSRNAYIPVVWG